MAKIDLKRLCSSQEPCRAKMEQVAPGVGEPELGKLLESFLSTESKSSCRIKSPGLIKLL